jgi:hypothetical protein
MVTPRCTESYRCDKQYMRALLKGLLLERIHISQLLPNYSAEAQSPLRVVAPSLLTDDGPFGVCCCWGSAACCWSWWSCCASMADAASCAGVDASLRADMGVAERGGSDGAGISGNISNSSGRITYSVHIYLHLCVFVHPVAPVAPLQPPSSRRRDGPIP